MVTLCRLSGIAGSGTGAMGMSTSLVNGLGGSAGFGENALGRTDDGYTGFIDLRQVFPDGLNMFGHVYTGLYLNNNGSVTFAQPTGTYTPSAISGGTGNPIIAPFWADVDTRGAPGNVTPGGTSTGANMLWYDLNSATHTFTATWDDVGYYSYHVDKPNAFQLQLIGVPDAQGNETGDFDIVFRYEAIQWVTGDASGGSGGLGGLVARAGYSSGDGVDYFDLPQSGDQAQMLALPGASNIGAPGTYLFSVRNGAALATISTSDISIAEGNGAPMRYAVIPVLLAAPSSGVITLAYATEDGTAIAGQDYIGQRGVITFASGMTQQNVYVQIVGDTVAEPDETFLLTLSDPSGAPIAVPHSVVTIVNDDGLTVADVRQAEGSGGGTTAFVFTVRLLTAAAGPVTVEYATEDGTALAGQDYTAIAGTLTFAAGETQKTVQVNVNADSAVESDKGFTLHLARAAGAQIARADATGTILNDDGLVVDNLSVVEGTGPGATMANVVLRLLSAQAGQVTVDWATRPGSALAGTDFTPATGTATFAPGVTQVIAQVPVVRDSLVQGNQDFTLVLSNPVGTAIVAGTGTVTIVDDDGFAVGDRVVTEGAGGGSSVTFTVTLQSALPDAATVRYATMDGTALAGQDYTAATGTLTFAAGQTSQTVTVPLAADTTPEPDETFSLVLSSPSANAGIAHGTGQALIVNDDGLSVGDASVPEGNGGLTGVVVPVTLSGPSAGIVTVAWSTEDGTASAASDYVAASGTLTFAPGSVAQNLTLGVHGDTVWEADETFRVVLSNPTGSAIVDGNGTVTILNDDTRPPPALSVTGTQQAEGAGPGTTIMRFVVSLSYAAASAVTVDYATADGTATAGSDYTASTGTLTIPAGALFATIEVPVVRDAVVEADETFTVTLSSPTGGAAIATATATGTILADDTGLAIAPTDASKAEGNSGSTPFTFTVSRAGSLARAGTVRWATVGLAPNSAGPNDFVGGVAPFGTLSFAAGESSKTITVNIQGDTLAEADEHFQVVLAAASAGSSITTASAAATILNDDTSFSIASTTGSHLEGNAGATPFVFTVTRSGNTSGANTVAWATFGALPNTAGPSDFIGGIVPSGTLSFAAGVVSQTLTVNVQGDTALEPDELFMVALRQPGGGATLATATALGKIVNDETSFGIVATDASKPEGNSGATPFTFTVTRGGNVGGTHLVSWQVSGLAPNTAGASDFVGGAAPGGTLTFAVGETSKTITVNVRGDTLVEPDEHFTVLLRNATGGATITTNSAAGTILNDDGTAPADLAGALSQVATADFTGDGTADLLRQSGAGDLYLLDGASGVMTALSLPAAGLRFVGAADFNGDGRADVLLQGGAGALYDWTMDGPVVRSVDLVTRLGAGQSVAALRDVTGDGRADILLHDGAAVHPYTLLAMNGGTVMQATTMASVPGAWHIA